MSRFCVQGSGSYWAVLDGGSAVANFSTWWRADEHADRLERRAMTRPRTCLTCGSGFMSEGPHNRMCAACRSETSEIYQGAV